jgi:hypothetical protein
MGVFAVLLASATLTPLLWQDPGAVEAIDFVRPAGGHEAPKPPFIFLEEDLNGTSAKIMIRDAAGVLWRMKGGPEGRAEAFVTRLVSALGYFAETTCFIADGRVEGITAPLRRASGFIGPDGSFRWAAFERRLEDAEFLDTQWTYLNSPFRGTSQLKGLKILVMLVSNWDNKDGRDVHKGSNTGVLKIANGGEPRATYFVNDWGQSLGGWGSFWGRSHWNCSDYTKQTARFVTGVHDGRVHFGYGGQHTKDFRSDITVEDVRWLMKYLGRVTDSQLKLGLMAAGATEEEQRCFSRELRRRIEQLRLVAGALP